APSTCSASRSRGGKFYAVSRAALPSTSSSGHPRWRASSGSISHAYCSITTTTSRGPRAPLASPEPRYSAGYVAPAPSSCCILQHQGDEGMTTFTFSAGKPALHALVIGVGDYPFLKGGSEERPEHWELGQLPSAAASALAFAG